MDMGWWGMLPSRKWLVDGMSDRQEEVIRGNEE